MLRRGSLDGASSYRCLVSTGTKPQRIKLQRFTMSGKTAETGRNHQSYPRQQEHRHHHHDYHYTIIINSNVRFPKPEKCLVLYLCQRKLLW